MIPSNCRTCVCYSYENWNRCRDWQTGCSLRYSLSCNCRLILNNSCNHRQWPSKCGKITGFTNITSKMFFLYWWPFFSTLIPLSVLFFTSARILSCAFLLIPNFRRAGNFSLTEEYFPGYEWILGELLLFLYRFILLDFDQPLHSHKLMLPTYFWRVNDFFGLKGDPMRKEWRNVISIN